MRVLLSLILAVCLPAAAATAWSPPQRQWLAAHPVLRVGVVLRPPYAALDADSGQYRGAEMALLQLLQQRLGVRLDPVPVADEATLERLGAARRIDLALGVEQTPQRLRYWQFSTPYWSVPYRMVVRAGNAAPASPGDLDGVDTALAGAALEPFLLRNYPLLQFRPTPTGREALRRLDAGTVRAALIDGAEARYWLRTQIFPTLALAGEVGIADARRVAVRDDWPLLGDIVERALADIPRRDLAALERTWIDPDRSEWWQGGVFWGAVALAAMALALTFGLLMQSNRRLTRTIARQLGEREFELQQRQAQALQLMHSQFTMDHSPVGILRLYWDGRVEYVNHTLCDTLGWQPAELAGMRLMDLDPSLDAARWLDFWRALRQRQFVNAERQYRCRDGTLLPVEVHARLLVYDTHEYLVLFVADIRERLRIRSALEASEARFRELANHVPGVVFQLAPRPDGGASLIYLSENCAAFCGYPAETVLAAPDPLDGVVHPQDRPDFGRSLAAALAGGAGWQWQGRIVTALGQERWIDLKASRRDTPGGAIWDGMAWDITALKRTEQSLAESRWLLRELAAHHETVREREKASLARELHDELGQILTALKLDAALCEMALGEALPAVAERLAGMKKAIDQTLRIARNVVAALRPPALDLGLPAALEWLVQRRAEQSGLDCRLSIDEHLPSLDEARAVILFRIVQEALTNVTRHAAARHVVVRLARDDNRLRLAIEDDGRGFDPSVATRAFGLVGIRERVWMLQGEVAIDSAPGNGTRIQVTLPLNEQESNT